MKQLSGQERNEFERNILVGLEGMQRLVLYELLNFANGKAMCWPKNSTIATRIGRKVRTVQYILRSLEDRRLIVTVPDPSGKGPRLTIILGHPGTAEALQQVARGACNGLHPPAATDCTGPMQSAAPRIQEGKSKKNSTVGRSEEPTSREEAKSDPVFRRFFGQVELEGD